MNKSNDALKPPLSNDDLTSVTPPIDTQQDAPLTTEKWLASMDENYLRMYRDEAERQRVAKLLF